MAVLLFILVASSLWYKDDTVCRLSISIPTCKGQNAMTSPQTFVHNDFRLDNIFFTPDEGPIVIDWQLAGRSRGTQDVSYLLSGIDWRMPQATWRPQASG